MLRPLLHALRDALIDACEGDRWIPPTKKNSLALLTSAISKAHTPPPFSNRGDNVQRSERNSLMHSEPAAPRNFLGQTDLRAAKGCAWDLVVTAEGTAL